MGSGRERLALAQVRPRRLFLGAVPVGRQGRLAEQRRLGSLCLQDRDENTSTRRKRNGLLGADIALLINLGFYGRKHVVSLPARSNAV